MRSGFVYISSRLKQMPFGLHLLTGLSVFAPVLALGFYIRDETAAAKALLEKLA